MKAKIYLYVSAVLFVAYIFLVQFETRGIDTVVAAGAIYCFGVFVGLRGGAIMSKCTSKACQERRIISCRNCRHS